MLRNLVGIGDLLDCNTSLKRPLTLALPVSVVGSRETTYWVSILCLTIDSGSELCVNHGPILDLNLVA